MIELSTSSVSKIKLILEIRGKTRISCELKRHLSPRTVGAIIRSLPLEGNAHLLGKSITYLDTPINSGIERPRKEFKKDDIAFLPISGSICFFFANSESDKTMTPIGKITSNVDELKNVQSWDIFSLYEDTG